MNKKLPPLNENLLLKALWPPSPPLLFQLPAIFNNCAHCSKCYELQK